MSLESDRLCDGWAGDEESGRGCEDQGPHDFT
jgi:hypothetical protein